MLPEDCANDRSVLAIRILHHAGAATERPQLLDCKSAQEACPYILAQTRETNPSKRVPVHSDSVELSGERARPQRTGDGV